jgi:ubiquinone/menaquinone biosynthesis C-methylase UbiE
MITIRCTGSSYRVETYRLHLVGVFKTALEGFGRGASAYERGRPGYPKAAVDWICERLQIGPENTVVDLGAGTGKFTRLLEPSGAKLYAVEPSAGMREQLEIAVPSATVLDASAEAIPLAAGVVDAVTAAQSFHWFATDRVLAELQRVLRPGGGLALVWNRRDMKDPLQLRLEKIIARYRAATPAHENDRWKDIMRSTTRFSPIGQREFGYEQLLDRGGLVDRVLSISFMAALPERSRDAIAREVKVAAGDASQFRLPYLTEAYLFRRAETTL